MATRLCVLLLALVCGCGSAPVLDLGPPPVGPPAPTLAVAPLGIGYGPTADRPRVRAGEETWRSLDCDRCGEALGSREGKLEPCPECGHDVFRPAFSPPFAPRIRADDVRGRVVDLLGQRGGFERVIALEVDSAAAAVGGAEARREAARRAGAAWLLEAEVEDARVELADTNWLQPVKVGVLLVSSLLIFPAVDPINWFLPGEDYGVRTRVRWRLSEVATGAELGAGLLETDARQSFAAFGPGPTRPWYVVGFLRVPSCLDEEAWTEIAAQLDEHAVADLTGALVRTAEAAATSPPR